MFAKICGWVNGMVSGLRSRMGLFVATLSVFAVSVLSGTAFAQEPVPIQVQAPNFDWNGLSQTLINALLTPIGVGIGIALSIWVIMKAVSFFKRSAA